MSVRGFSSHCEWDVRRRRGSARHDVEVLETRSSRRYGALCRVNDTQCWRLCFLHDDGEWRSRVSGWQRSLWREIEEHAMKRAIRSGRVRPRFRLTLKLEHLGSSKHRSPASIVPGSFHQKHEEFGGQTHINLEHFLPNIQKYCKTHAVSGRLPPLFLGTMIIQGFDLRVRDDLDLIRNKHLYDHESHAGASKRS